MNSRGSDWQLVFFTTLTQMSVGTFILGWVASLTNIMPKTGLYPLALSILVLATLTLGVLSAGLHLKRPSQALFSISNLGRSWLSREALLGGSFGLLGLILFIRQWLGSQTSLMDWILILVGSLTGLALVYVISRLYMLRTVPAWNHAGTPATFITTTFLLGTLAVSGIGLGVDTIHPTYGYTWADFTPGAISTALILVFALIQLAVFLWLVLHLNAQGGAALGSVRLLWTRLRWVVIARILSMFLGTGLLILSSSIRVSLTFLYLAYGLILISEIIGRFLFYGFYQREGF